MSKKDTPLYLHAAELMHERLLNTTGCCYAISRAEQEQRRPGEYNSELQHRFAKIFAPEGWRPGCYWFGSSREEQEIRVLALCFAAAMAAKGDL